ncbi:MAG: LacI family DNA-binding transcriptional regulator [Akkermansiaceae bacterium]
MVTITDISEKMGISTATVSRALNNSRLVSPDLRGKICTTANEMGYKKREIRRHRGRGILNIKLVLPRHEEPERALFYDLASLIEGVRSGFELCEINLICEPTCPDYDPFPHKKGGDINGFIFAFHRPSEAAVEKLREFGTPFAVLNRDIDGLPCVASENKKGMETLVSHLIEKRENFKPAYISFRGLGQIDRERLGGLETACESKGIPFDRKKDTHYFSGVRAIDGSSIAKLADEYDSLVCVNDIVGTVVLSELDRLGIQVPEKLAVTGFDDSPVRQLSRPLLTTISLPVTALARSAASRLESEIIEHAHPESTLRVPGTLIEGESC